MINDYNLVIIGNTSIARYAGIKAVNKGARVALVLTPENNWITTGYLYNQVLNHLQIETSNFREIKQKADEVINNYFVYNNNDVLASLGIDIICGKGNFLKQPKLGFLVNDRVLTSKSYLIATGSYSPLPDIEGIKETDFLTPDNIWLKLTGEKLADNWVIMGGNPRAIELTQTLINLGVKNISLIVKENHILVEEETEAGLLIQAYLEGQGVTIFTQTEVKQIKQINREKWVLIGNKALETEEILICTDPQLNIQDLNLENVGVKFNQKGIDINDKMQ
ncbi:MAG TPA: FAD-dependent oxidoreductase, partial [Allocoleopsis sp.]